MAASEHARPRQGAILFEVDDIEAAAARERDPGGTADAPSPEKPGFGRFTSCTGPGPDAIRFGPHQRQARGEAAAAAAGAPQ